MPVDKINKDTYLIRTTNYTYLVKTLLLSTYLILAWDEASWWILVIVITIFIFVAITNKNFVSRTTISRALAKVNSSQWTIIGPQSISIPFEEIVRIKISHGKGGQYTLIIESYNHYLEAVSSYHGDGVIEFATTLEDWLELNSIEPIPRKIDSNSQYENLLISIFNQIPAAPTLYHKGDLVWTDLSTFTELPMGETALFFIETESSVRKGIMFGTHGIYWKNNDLITPTRQNWLTWEQFIHARIQKDPEDNDLWLGHGMQIGLRTAAQQQLAYTLLLAIQDQISSTDAAD
ncbi:MAG: hypothetical protein CMK59_09170 [Proteobacteria bacterium]|nr:hypothetical protein [Pseudomonadota bacterium]